MTSLIFWNHWSRPYRLTYLLSLLLFALSLIAFLTAWVRGLGNVVRWDVLSELTDLPITLQTFTDGLLDYSIPGKAYAVSEQFVASAMEVHPSVATAFVVGLCAAFALLLSAVTAFGRIAYLVAMTVFVAALSLFRFEMLDISGLDGPYLFLLLAFAFGSVSYYFHAFRSDIGLPIRLAVFGVLVAVVAFGLGALARVPFPALQVASYGLPVLLLLSVGFIGFIAFEIVAALVWLTSANRLGGRPLGLRNFVFISLLYLANLALIYLTNTKSVDWDVYTISPFVIYLISLVVGLWGFKQLTDQRDSEPFQDVGAYLYIGLGVVTTLTIGYALATANDPLIEVFEDTITYSHFVMGGLFVGYVLVNFRAVFQQNLPVYRVLYKPRTLQLPLVRLLGVVGIVALLYGQNFFPIKQAMTGYYNGVGDLYTATGETTSAVAFYELAIEQEYQNHKSNYALASLAAQQGDLAAASGYFQRALLKQPSPQAYAGLSSMYLQNNLFFEGLKALQRGIRTFPKSGELRNNLGYLYAKTSVVDSAYFYLQSAPEFTGRADVPKANLLAFWAKHPQLLSSAASLPLTNESDYESYQANALALRLVTGSDTAPAKAPRWLAEPAGQPLNTGRFADVYNYALAASKPDTNLLGTLKRESLNPANQALTDDLLFARSVAEYRNYHPADAFALLGQLAENDARNGSVYRTTAGLWLLEQGLYRKAAQLLELNTDTLSAYYRALALTKAGDAVAAQSLWEMVAKNDSVVAGLAQVLYDQRKPVSELEKAFYVVYRPDDTRRGILWETMKDPNLRTVAGASLISQYIVNRQPFYAQMILSQLPPPAQLNAFALSLENLSALRITVAKKNLKAAQVFAARPFLPQHQAERYFLLGQAYEKGRQQAPARQVYEQALRLAPLNADIVTTVAQFERQQGRTRQAYELALNALNVNEDNPGLLKTYSLLCLDLSLSDYAEEALSRLQTTTTPADYQVFLATYQQQRALLEKQRQKFLQ
ncbi:MAG: hypothetical protein H7Z72_04675 [Bacteroidetes bacterium]|nr:hypothetical protein [Fibrella sp.]